MRVSTLVLALAIAFVPMMAHADDQPWAVGVTDARKAGAQKLLEEGNALFLKKDYAQALEKYKAAVGSWDHPAIRFNMVRCLIQLDKPVEASDSLALALCQNATERRGLPETIPLLVRAGHNTEHGANRIVLQNFLPLP